VLRIFSQVQLPSMNKATPVDRDAASLCDRVCRKAACDIQYCLQRFNYQEAKCRREIDAWAACCDAAKRGVTATPQGGC
jgi:hypothetical protein